MDLLMETQIEEFLDKSKFKKREDFFKYNQNLRILKDDIHWLTNINLFEMSVLNLKTIIKRMINTLENKNILKINEVTVDKNIRIQETNFHRYSYFRTKLFLLNIFYNDEKRKKELVYILKEYIPNQLNFYISSFNFIQI